MNKTIVIGIAALLLGIVVSMPVRVSALENTVENGNVVEREITQAREINPITNAISWALLGLSVGVLSFAVGFAMIIFGFVLTLTIIGAPLGIFLILLGLIFMFILPILCVVIISPNRVYTRLW